MHPVAKALIDRHDMNDDSADGVALPDTVRIAHPMDDTNDLLRQIVERGQGDLIQLCLTDIEPAQEFRDNFPVRGMSRIILRRTGEGGDFTLTQNTPLLIVNAAEYRIGGEIVNIGSNAVKLYLAKDMVSANGTPLLTGVPIIGLNGNGGGWNMQVNNTPWCGNVIALCTAVGGSEVTVALF